MPYNTLIFFGAGSTAQIGSPTTVKQEDFLKALVLEKGTIKERLKSHGFKDEDFIKDISLTLRLLYDGNGVKSNDEAIKDTEKAKEEFSKQFKNINKSDIYDYLGTYFYPYFDWLAFKSISESLLEQSDNVDIQDILTVLIRSYSENISLPTPDIFPAENRIYVNYSERIKGALRIYKLLIFKFFKYNLKKIDKTIYKNYEKFCNNLTEFFINAADFHFKKDYIVSYKQENIVLPLYLATLNWDPIFPFLFMKSCKKQNEKLIKKDNLVYLSHGYPFFVRKLKGKDSGWFVFEEDSAALMNIMNVEKRKSNLHMKLLKFFTPHGLMNLRICPRCGTAFLILPDDVGNINLDNLTDIFLLDPIPSKYDLQKIEKIDSLKNNLPSKMECPICNTPTFFKDTFLEIQSMIKLEAPPPIKKIYTDYSLNFSKAEHLIFIGYSFPKDDIPHLLSLLTMSISPEQKEKKFTLILYENRLKKTWYSLEEAKKYLIQYNPESPLLNTIANVLKLTKKDNVRINFYGFPDVLKKISLNQLLKWSLKNFP